MKQTTAHAGENVELEKHSSSDGWLQAFTATMDEYSTSLGNWI